MRLVLISDSHMNHIKVPDGDVLIHAGDLTCAGSWDEVYSAARWLGTLPHEHKIVVAGNHDRLFENDPTRAEELMRSVRLIYLQDASAFVRGLNFYGSPWQPDFCHWAFNLPRGTRLAAIWTKIPLGTDILITHGPPRGILDRDSSGESCGCDDLLGRVKVVKPILHVFGHIHPSHGVRPSEDTLFVNASVCNDPGNRPDFGATVVEL